MKILYFHQHFSTRSGAAGTRSYEMGRQLVERGHQVTIVCGSYGAGATGLDGSYESGMRMGVVDGINVIEFELPYSNKDNFLKRIGTFIKFAFRSTWIALRADYDLLVATSTPLTAGIPGIWARLLRRKKFVFEVRDLWPELPRAMGVIRNPVVLFLMCVLEWTSYRAANACIGLSPGIVEGICRRGISPVHVALIPNGCDLDVFSRASAEPWRPKGIEADDFVAIFTGTHGTANGLHALLDVANDLKRLRHNHIKLLFVGDGKEKSSLVERAQRENLDNCIFHDPIPKSRLSGLMATADVGLMVLANVPAFYFGTSPNKFFDYLSASLPVVNNYPGWLAELIRRYDCGLAVPPGDSMRLAEALIEMAADREKVRVMGCRARDLAETQFDRRKLSTQFSEWLEGVMSDD